MKLAVLSDIHDHLENLDKALTKIKQSSCQELIFCGDMVAPFTAKILAQAKIPTYAVFGNNDGDKASLIKNTQDSIQFFTDDDEYGLLERDNLKIGFVHYPKIAQAMSITGHFDAVFYGHTHVKDLKQSPTMVTCNPGAICGIISGQPGPGSFIIFDTQTKKVDFIDI